MPGLAEFDGVEREHRQRVRLGVGDDAPIERAAERLRRIGIEEARARHPVAERERRSRFLAAPLESRHERVAHASFAEVDPGQGLSRQQLLVARPGKDIAVDRDLLERRAGRRHGRDQRLREAHVALVVGIARLDVETNRIADAMHDLRGRDAGLRLEVVVLEAVVVVARHVRGARAEPRQAVIGTVVRGLQQVAQRDLRIRVEAERETRRDTETLRFHRATFGLAVMREHVQPERRRVAEQAREAARGPPSRARSRRCRR